MAERSSRSSNRRTTQRSPPNPRISNSPPPRAQRVTRSQSHGVSDNEAGLIGAKRRRKDPSPLIVSGDEASTQRKRQPKLSSRVKAKSGLPAVVERPTISYPQLSNNETENVRGEYYEVVKAQKRTSQSAKSPGNNSAISGTTARTSRSSQEISALYAEDMVEALGDLSDASEKILSLLIPGQVSQLSIANVRKPLSDANSMETKKLGRLGNAFQAHSNIYGGVGFISVLPVLKATFNVPKRRDLPLGRMRMDPILYKANLVTLSMKLLAQNDERVNQTVEELDKVFPGPFLHRFVRRAELDENADSSSLSVETFQLGLDIRTNCFIAIAKQHVNQPNFDPDSVLQQVFYSGGGMLNGWDAFGLRTEDLSNEFQKKILSRLDSIRRSFSQEAPYIHFQTLTDQFSLAQLATAVVEWGQQRLLEVNSQIYTAGGPDGVIRAVQNGVIAKNTVSTGVPETDTPIAAQKSRLESGPMVPLEASNSGRRKGEMSRKIPMTAAQLQSMKLSANLSDAQKASIDRLKQRRVSKDILVAQRGSHQEDNTIPSISQEYSAIDSAEASSHSAAQSVVPASIPGNSVEEAEPPANFDADWQAPGISDDENNVPENENPSQVLAIQILRDQKRLDEDSNKENPLVSLRQPPRQLHENQGPDRALTEKRSLMDRQENAERVSFDSDSQESSPSHHERSGEQGIQDHESDHHYEMSQDVGFQTDNRPITTSIQSRVATSGNRHGLRPTTSSVRRPRRHQITRNIREAVEEDDVRGAVEQHNNVDVPAPSQSRAYRRVNSTAKLDVSVRVPKKPQTRTPWSVEETGLLLDLIQDNGLSWALIKKIDDSRDKVLWRRDQVALKDKARNMKVDYLKVGTTLPLNFENIPLNKLQIQKLASLGIEYDPVTGRIMDDDAEMS